jgi:hypothetical protein
VGDVDRSELGPELGMWKFRLYTTACVTILINNLLLQHPVELKLLQARLVASLDNFIVVRHGRSSICYQHTYVGVDVDCQLRYWGCAGRAQVPKTLGSCSPQFVEFTDVYTRSLVTFTFTSYCLGTQQSSDTTIVADT